MEDLREKITMSEKLILLEKIKYLNDYDITNEKLNYYYEVMLTNKELYDSISAVELPRPRPLKSKFERMFNQLTEQ